MRSSAARPAASASRASAARARTAAARSVASARARAPSSGVASRGSVADHAWEVVLVEGDEVGAVRQEQRGLEESCVVTGGAEVREELIVGNRDGVRAAGDRRAAHGDGVLQAIVAVDDEDVLEAHRGETFEHGGERRLGDLGGKPQRVGLRHTAGRPPRRWSEHGARAVGDPFGERLSLEEVEPERQVVAVPLDRPQRHDERRALGEPRLELTGPQLFQPMDHAKLTTVRTPPSAGWSNASSSSSSVIRRPIRSATGIVPLATQSRSCGRWSAGRAEP